jgi:hypothetical protein
LRQRARSAFSFCATLIVTTLPPGFAAWEETTSVAWIPGGIQASVLLVQADEAGEGDNGDNAARKTALKRKSLAIGLPLLVKIFHRQFTDCPRHAKVISDLRSEI